MMKETPERDQHLALLVAGNCRSTNRSSAMPTRPTPRPATERDQPEVAAAGQQAVAEIGAEHEERAMREIGNAHQPEDQRESGRQQEQQAAEGHAVQRLDDPELHCMEIALTQLAPLLALGERSARSDQVRGIRERGLSSPLTRDPHPSGGERAVALR